ncbi:MAG TPA: hypothetical protein VFH83_06355, partial [Spirochaetia bacterium]|nr:hypothetical protein [Spirochaetia bacterium]
GTPERHFLIGVFASPHFLQFGRDYSGAPDQWVYAYSSAGDDGIATWSAGDQTYLGRVPRDKILEQSSWEFFCGSGPRDVRWSRNVAEARPVFSYPKKTGENEVVFHPGLGRYLLLNWAYIDCTNHTIGSLHSELSVFEAPKPWGPWETVHVLRDWGHNCDYQPRLPAKWMDPMGPGAWLVSAGNFRQIGGRIHYGFGTVPVRFGTGDFGAAAGPAAGGPATAGGSAPSELGDFSALPLSDTEIELSWLPVQGVGFYRIERDGVKLKDIAPCYPARFIDTGLPPAGRHEYRVHAFSPAGDAMESAGPSAAQTLPATEGRSFGVNLAGPGLFDGETLWLGQDSQTRFSVVTAGAFQDSRIRTLPLRPPPGALEGILRGFRGEVSGVKVVFRGLSGKKLKVWVYVVDPRLCGTKVQFGVLLQGVLVETYRTSLPGSDNWGAMGPYDVQADSSGEVILEGRNFTGLGGIAAARIQVLG